MLYHHKDAPGGIPVNAAIISGVDIPFWNLVMLLVKIALASIPAGIIVLVVYAVSWAFLWSTLLSANHR